jgi:TRAP-type C4-dicarboxylate transport system substrate-binding protein
MLKRATLMLAAAAVVAAGVLAAASQASAATVWRFSRWVPPTHPLNKEVFEVWAKKVAEATHGDVKIQFVSALGNPPSHFDLVKNGVADVGMSVNSYTANRFVLSQGLELPFLAPNAMSACIAYWKTYEKYFKKANEYKGVHLLGIWLHGPGQIFTREKKINTLKDLDHLKMRVPGGVVNEIAKRLDTVPVFAPASQAYNVLSKGVADGIFFPTESIYNFKLGPVIKQGLEIPGGLYRLAMYIVVNQAKWDALPEKDRKAIDSVSGMVIAKLAGAMWDKADADGKKGLLKLGTQFHVASPAMMKSLHSKLDSMTAEWFAKAKKKGVDGKAALNYFEAQVKAAEK